MNAKALAELAEYHFKKKGLMNSLWQEVSDHFYPERADFTLKREVGQEFAEHLMTSYPVMIRRDLGDQLATMLRPLGKAWFNIIPADPEREDSEAKLWLESATSIQRRAMYDPVTMLNRATKEGDHDFVTFGQTAISCEIVWDHPGEGPHLLHRCWHLRDMAWTEDRYGKVGNRFRRWKPTARDLAALFPGKVHSSVTRLATSPGAKPFTEIECMHMVVEADMYNIDKAKLKGKPWVSVYWDATNRHLIEEVASWSPHYVIPRWQTVSGSQYAYSPATIVGLPDARLIQAMTSTLLEAGEKMVNPPMKATEEVVRSDIAIFPGGITWVDRDYDEKLGAALEPLISEVRGIPIGVDMMKDARQIIAAAFYLNKLSLPQRAPEMTAYEVGQRIQQYIRDALPIFEPMESDYNGQLCDLDFDLLRRAGAFGSPYDMPQILQGAKVTFRFSSPLHEAIESQKSQKFLEMSSLLAQAAQMDPTTMALPDAKVAFRDALAGAGIPTKWVRSESLVKRMEEQAQAQKQAQAMIQNLLPASQAVSNLAGAAKDIVPAQVP